MSLGRHIRLCNEYHPERFMPLWRGATRIGLIRRENAEALRPFPDVFVVAPDGVRLVAAGDCAALTAAIDRVVERLLDAGRIAAWRNEAFAVNPRWGEPPIFKLDRGAVPFFGVRAYGVHLNGYRRRGDAVELWIGRRAADKKVAPDKLDNLVAGGIGDGHGVFETLAKEAQEEASVPPDLIAKAVAAGAISYRMEMPHGLRDDVLFLFDLEVPLGFTPQNTDGEIVAFEPMAAGAVVERVRRTDDFKFNVNLVIIDFALRHGLVTPDDPEYLGLVLGLHRPLDEA
jgi:8-oxo-dGTP pyrophosphatase MutT (NUDIX family)